MTLLFETDKSGFVQFLSFHFVIKLAQYIAINHAIIVKIQFSPLTPMSDQDRISPYNINTISTR